MAVTAACFKWADVLENQFDKSWVELDTILCQLEDDEVKEVEMSKVSKQSPASGLFRTLGCCTCRGGEPPPLWPPASLSLLTSRPPSSRFTFFFLSAHNYSYLHLSTMTLSRV